ncbi:hypothetical protein WH50_09550 [Pokkaliibacter plantistimulans]|uniref:TonB-dependent receptor n=2 Tax=Pseudomonadota TaxID=1224 RepID=A0ABX5LY09_9GAMM|nr:TonB-dependent receptor [Pokkaliibacter plantistimulans]PPC75952.1 hypothetical protein C4K68_17405 [Pokkaliibacter plantistimulans]PXF31537.1 hypothetical protein WH50_09550 [Pokkaliibacter plantistimulans]
MKSSFTAFAGAGLLRPALTPLAVACLTATFAVNALAADDDTTTDELLVTASRLPQEASSVGSSVTVLTRQQLEQRQITRVADALRGMPGINIYQTSTPGSVTYARIRGLNQRFVKVVIDGVTVNDPSDISNSMDLGSLLVADIERIEIVRGPQSALWGSDAIGGVIQIITRQGGTNRTNLRAEAGTNDTQTLSLSGSGSAGKVDYGYGLSGLHSDAFSSLNEDRGNDEKDKNNTRQVNGRVTYHLTDDWDVRLNVSHNYSRLDYDGYDPLTFALTDNNDFSTAERNSVRLETNFALLDGNFENRIGFSHANTLRNYYTEASGNYDYEGESNKADYQGQYHFGIAALPNLENTLIVALEHEEESFNSTYSAQGEADNSSDSWVAEYRADLSDTASLSLSHRFDDNHDFDNENSSRAALSWNILPQTRLHTSYGTGIKNPSLYQLFDAYSGNRDLTAEESHGGDIGIEQKLGDWSLDLTWFSNRVKNQIDYDYSTFTYQNVEGVTRSKGVEVSANGKINAQLQLNASYTYTDVDNEEDSTALLRQPWHEGSVYVDYKLAGLPAAINTGIVYKGQRDDSGSHHLPSYTVVNVSGRYDLNPTWQLTARVENLFDREYEELYGYGTQGRALYVGVNAAF